MYIYDADETHGKNVIQVPNKKYRFREVCSIHLLHVVSARHQQQEGNLLTSKPTQMLDLFQIAKNRPKTRCITENKNRKISLVLTLLASVCSPAAAIDLRRKVYTGVQKRRDKTIHTTYVVDSEVPRIAPTVGKRDRDGVSRPCLVGVSAVSAGIAS